MRMLKIIFQAAAKTNDSNLKSLICFDINVWFIDEQHIS